MSQNPEPTPWSTALSSALGALALAVAIALAGADGGASVRDLPVLLWCALLAFVIQWLAFVPACLRHTERFYDLVGSLTYITVVATALLLSPVHEPRSFALAAMVLVWALRLGTFLFRRIRRSGHDRRFDAVRSSPPRFFLAWTLQGLWVFLTLAAALAAMTAGFGRPLNALDVIGSILWIGGFTIEVVADAQKSAFRRLPENRDTFIQDGLWSWSRHPNYFGEIVLWLGVAVIASSTLAGWRWLTLVSPVFVFLLLTRGSGIPLLEEQADKRWGGRADYKAYKAQTSVLIPLPPRRQPPTPRP